MDAVRQLRPHWLRTRGPTSLRNPGRSAIVVYVDDVRLGGVEYLETLRAASVASMEYLDGSEASVRFGTGHEGGAILVRTPR